MLKILKIAEHQGPVVSFLCRIFHEGLPPRAYLNLDLRQASFDISLSKHKPKSAKNPSKSAYQLLKKHLEGFAIHMMQVDEMNNTWLSLKNSDNKQYLLLVEKSRPPMLQMVDLDTKTVHLRLGQSGTFTKKKDFDKSLTELDCQLTALFESFKLSLADNEQGKDNEQKQTIAPKPAATENQDQKDAIKKLRRRLKTLTRSLSKHQQQVPSLSDIENAKTPNAQ